MRKGGFARRTHAEKGRIQNRRVRRTGRGGKLHEAAPLPPARAARYDFGQRLVRRVRTKFEQGRSDKVSAKDLGTNKEQNITITASTNLKEEDINTAIKEAEAHAEEDKKRKEFVETKNNADNMVYSLEKMLKENGDKLSAEDKKKLEDAIEKAKKDFESEDVEVIKKALDELTQVSNEVFTKMYQNANPNGANGANGGAGANSSADGNDPDVTIE